MHRRVKVRTLSVGVPEEVQGLQYRCLPERKRRKAVVRPLADSRTLLDGISRDHAGATRRVWARQDVMQ